MPKNPSTIIIRVPPERARFALKALVAGLERLGHTAHLEAAGSAPADAEVERVLAFERRLHRDPETPGLRLPLPAAEPRSGVIISLAGPMPEAEFALWLDGETGLDSLETSLVNGHVPLIELRDRAGTVRAAGLPGIEQREILGRSLVGFYARLATVIDMALDGAARSLPDRNGMRETPGGTTPLGYFLRHTAQKVAGRIAPARQRAEHWRIGIRPVTGRFRPDGDGHPHGFLILPDDGGRCYADPVLWEDGERTFLLMEEFPYDTGIGCLAYTELAPDGRALHSPRRMLERRTHLSYPFVFRHDGDIYLLPENAASGALTLYRARQFPEVWEEHSVLIPGRALHDATLIEKDGRWWLLANEEFGGSSWDVLVIFSGESPLGPFQPHGVHPILVDARLSRPAGPVLRDGSRLIRPVQSCLGGYGQFLRFTEITQLDDQGFRQREIGRMMPEGDREMSGLHTYARSSRFEAIDLLTRRNWRLA
ncbi:MAG: hypothetical protein IOC59_03465 [Methylobacterium sp.]|nr:hypothetical protein [Methylobacterium sp.]MCA3603239.1 hypothetical protein [Methylobacterium sp.]MCA3614261.1 hypothetical protein [Methylobacterium sp.]